MYRTSPSTAVKSGSLAKAVETATTNEDDVPHIFAELVNVHVKPVGRDEFVAELTVRLRPDNMAHPRNLLLELTDEDDLFFYHSLVLGEGDFHALKSEQRLLVDFQSFPSQLAGLLRRCVEASSGLAIESSKMLACLDCSSTGDGTFSIVESNNFRELTHIALRCRQGSDEVVKQHLAGKLRLLRQGAAELQERLRLSDEALSSTRRQADELGTRARVVAEERQHLERTLEATHLREVAELRSEHLRAIAELQQQALSERSRLEADLRQSLEAASARASRAERASEELQQQRQALTASGESLRERLAASELRRGEAEQEVVRLREQTKQLEALKFQLERDIAELKVQQAAFKETLSLREQHGSSQQSQIDEAMSQRRQMEELLSAARQQVLGLEEKLQHSSQEITKGNRIIQQLHDTSKQAKAKLRLKATALAQQERSLLELEKADELHKHVMDEREHELSRRKAREERLHQDLEELRKKLAEAHDVIKSNQEVIEYLNRQLTEKDLKAIPSFSATTATGSLGTGTALAELLARSEGLALSSRLGFGSDALAKLGLGSLGLGSSPISGTAYAAPQAGACRSPYFATAAAQASSPARASSVSTGSTASPGASPLPWQTAAAISKASAGSLISDFEAPVAYRRPQVLAT